MQTIWTKKKKSRLPILIDTEFRDKETCGDFAGKEAYYERKVWRKKHMNRGKQQSLTGHDRNGAPAGAAADRRSAKGEIGVAMELL